MRETKRINEENRIFSPPDGDIIVDPQIDMLKILFLYVGGEFWNSGSGDSYIDFYDDGIMNRLEVLLSDPHGFYVRYQSNGQDFHSSSEQYNSVTTTIYVAGNPPHIPSKFFHASGESIRGCKVLLRDEDAPAKCCLDKR